MDPTEVRAVLRSEQQRLARYRRKAQRMFGAAVGAYPHEFALPFNMTRVMALLHQTFPPSPDGRSDVVPTALITLVRDFIHRNTWLRRIGATAPDIPKPPSGRESVPQCWRIFLYFSLSCYNLIGRYRIPR
jgi:hypothetical protein